MTNQISNQTTPVPPSGFSSASGKIDYTLMNDYIFHRVMQKSQKVLKGLLCALLHLAPAQIRSIEILDPIEPGDAIGDKTFCLDIKILMNNHAIINIELQVLNEHNWPERSLGYLCRLFDNLNAGDDYVTVKPACHIGILNFTLFPEQSEFYATYQLMNQNNNHIYSDKFTLHVLDLTQIQTAGETDKAYGLDRWAKLFKATTWEDFKMIAADDKAMQEAGETVFKLNRTDSERYLCEARERGRRSWNTLTKQLETAKADLAEKEAALVEKDAAIVEKDAAIIERDTVIAELKNTIARLKAEAAQSQ